MITHKYIYQQIPIPCQTFWLLTTSDGFCYLFDDNRNLLKYGSSINQYSYKVHHVSQDEQIILAKSAQFIYNNYRVTEQTQEHLHGTYQTIDNSIHSSFNDFTWHGVT